MKIEFTIPLNKDLIVSEANRGSEHWTKKAKRHRIQHFLINAYMTKNYGDIDATKLIDHLPLEITLTRVAPNSLDTHDNLPMSMKYYVDALADKIIPGLPKGHADDDIRLKWHYSQEKGHPKQYAIKVKIEKCNDVKTITFDILDPNPKVFQ
jgi:hypothetical protein